MGLENSFQFHTAIVSTSAGGDRWVVCHFTRCCSAIVEGLSPSTIYRFRVSAVNDFGYSTYSLASPETRTQREGEYGGKEYWALIGSDYAIMLLCY